MGYYIVDGHCDTVCRFLADNNNYDFTRYNRDGHIDLPRLKDGGIKIQFFSVYVDTTYKLEGALRKCLQLLDAYYSIASRCEKELQTIYNVTDLKKVMEDEKIGALLVIEGGEALEGSISVLRMLFRLGVRGLGLTWNQRNQLATGVGEGRKGEGLTFFGCKVVQELNALGMIVDLAHINENGFFDAISISSKPVVVSHANARTLCDHPRNLTDKQLRCLRNNNGVVGLSFNPSFIHRKSPSLNKLLDHFVHMAEVAGVDHIGIGSDFDGIKHSVEGLDDVTCLPFLVEGLLARGFSPKETEQITSKNFLRVLKENLPE